MAMHRAQRRYGPLAQLLSIALTGFALQGSTTPATADDAADIRGLIAATWDKPDANVDVGPIVVSGDHAIAGWTQGPRGGRALLRRTSHGWSVHLCGGDALKDAAALEQSGVPHAAATHLVTTLASAEANLSPERRAALATFDGLMPVDGGHHTSTPGATTVQRIDTE